MIEPPRRRDITREHLVATVEDGFIERGYANASVGWLAARAGYTTGAIYSSIGDKAQLFFAVLERRHAAMLDGWRAAAESPDPERALAASIAERLEDPAFLAWSTAYFEFLGPALREEKMRSAVAAYLEQAVRDVATIFEPLATAAGLPAEDLARLLLATANGLALTPASGGRSDTAVLMRTFLGRLLTPVPDTSAHASDSLSSS